MIKFQHEILKFKIFLQSLWLSVKSSVIQAKSYLVYVQRLLFITHCEKPFICINFVSSGNRSVAIFIIPAFYIQKLRLGELIELPGHLSGQWFTLRDPAVKRSISRELCIQNFSFVFIVFSVLQTIKN